MTENHLIFVDFENVHEVDLTLIEKKPVHLFLVLGKRHTSLPIELVKKLLLYSAQVQLIETGYSGKNALDFVLSYHIGVQSVTHPKGIFHILSRDKGFDALVHHLEMNKINVTRHEAFIRIPILGGVLPQTIKPIKTSKPIKATKTATRVTSNDTTEDRVKDMTERFSHNLSRPTRKKTLLTHIHVRFGKKLSEPEIEKVVEGLIANKVIEISPQGAVLYLC